MNPNATLTFIYNASDLVDSSSVEYTHLLREKKFGHWPATTAACPSDIVSFWTKKEIPTILIDIPNRKKVIKLAT